MKSVLTIIKKEFRRFFTDRRMVITVLMPGLMIYIVYSLMGVMITNSQIQEDYKPTAYVVNMPAVLSSAFESILEEPSGIDGVDAAKDMVASGELDIVVVFSDNFDIGVAVEGGEVQIFYNSANDTSSYGYTMVVAVLESLQKTSFSINSSSEVQFDLGEEGDLAASILSMVIPMVMLSLLSSACMAVAPESIAGEKERGTMSTMLITPIKRWQLALGKIISLSCFALLSGISSFIGLILSLPKLTGGLVAAETLPYAVGDYFMLFGLIISIVLVIISAFSILSCLAKSVKESGSLIAPLMIVIILLGMISMFVNGVPPVGLYAIPLVGSVLAISSIMGLTASGLGVALAIISNIVVAALLTVLLAFMFRNESIMFKK